MKAPNNMEMKRPRSVQVALAMFPTMAVLWLLMSMDGLRRWRSGAVVKETLVSTLIVYAVLAIGYSGLVRGKRSAWKWNRRVAWGLGSLFLFGVVTVVAGAARERPEGPFLPVLASCLGIGIPNLVLAICLGRPSARSHFGASVK
jgi:hypothetical protein